MQSVPITTEVVSSNPAQAMCPLIQNYVIKCFVSDQTAGRWFSPVLTKKKERHELTEIS